MKKNLVLKVLGAIAVIALAVFVMNWDKKYTVKIHYKEQSIGNKEVYEDKIKEKVIYAHTDSAAYDIGYHDFAIAMVVQREMKTPYSIPQSVEVVNGQGVNIKYLILSVAESIEAKIDRQTADIHINSSVANLLDYSTIRAEPLETTGKAQWKIYIKLSDDFSDKERLTATIRHIEHEYSINIEPFKTHKSVTVMAIYVFDKNKKFPTDDYGDWIAMLSKGSDDAKGVISFMD